MHDRGQRQVSRPRFEDSIDATHALPSTQPAVKSIIRKIVALTATPAAKPKLAMEEAYHGDK